MTRRHDFLIDRATAYNELLINNSISAEQVDRGRAFKELLDSFEKLQADVATMPELLLVPDTNVYLHHQNYLNDVDWSGLSKASGSVRVMVPMAVVRELDSLRLAPQDCPTMSRSNLSSTLPATADLRTVTAKSSTAR